jgi:microcystin-dependent protein
VATLTKTHTDDAWLGATRKTHTDDALIASYGRKLTHTDDARTAKTKVHTDDGLIVDSRGSFRGEGTQAQRDTLTNVVAGDTFLVADDSAQRHMHFYTGSYWMPAKAQQSAENGVTRVVASATAVAGHRAEGGDPAYPWRVWDGSEPDFYVDATGNVYGASVGFGSASSMDNADTITLPENPLTLTPSRRQVRTATGTTTASPTWSPATAAGNLLVFISWASLSNTTPSVATPPTGYTLAADSGASGSKRIVIYYKANSSASEANPSIVWNTGTGITCAAVIEEVANIVTGSPLDRTATALGAALTGTTGATAVTTKAAEYAVGGIGVRSGAPINPDSGFTTAASPTDLLVADRILTSKTSVGFSAAILQQGGDTYAGAVATFKAKTGSGSVATPPGGSGSFYVAANPSGGLAIPYFIDDGGNSYQLNVPTGFLMPAAVGSAPPGWLLCDGASYLRSAYPALFAAIGTAYGALDGTHFSVPGMAGRFPLGVSGGGTGNVLGATGGLIDHQHFPPNTSGAQSAGDNVTTAGLGGSTSLSKPVHTHAVTVAADNPPFQTFYYYIKT